MNGDEMFENLKVRKFIVTSSRGKSEYLPAILCADCKFWGGSNIEDRGLVEFFDCNSEEAYQRTFSDFSTKADFGCIFGERKG